MDKELPVSVWPEWKIIEKIGEGSFGKVYKAQRTEQGKCFYSAIKIITIPASRSELNSVRSETSDEQSARDYFQNLVEECIQEVSTMEYFRGNSYVVSVEDFKVMEYLDEIGWDIYIRMEYLQSFMDYCTGKNLSEKEVIQLGIDLCRALEYCGQLHIIHRDIKPENIFVSRFGEFKLGDFGIARELERTMSGLSKKGTYSYMAPEMYRGEQYDGRVDIYSLGLVLYKLMNHNRLPFLNLEKQLITYRDKENALARRMSGEKMPGPADAGEEFSRIILKACACRPKERYQQAADFLKDLDDLKNGRLEPPRLPEVQKAAEPPVRLPEAQKAAELPVRLPEAQKAAEPPVRLPPTRPVQETHRKKKRAVSPWTVAVIVVAVAACIITGIYIKLLMDDSVPEAPVEAVEMMGEDGAQAEGEEQWFSQAVQEIRDHATTITDHLQSYEPIGQEGERIRYYDGNSVLMKSLVYPALSLDDVYEEYYYWNGQMFFAYIWSDKNDKKPELYYYKNGKLIRWIDESGACHDNETEFVEYVERGEKYWQNSLEQLE